MRDTLVRGIALLTIMHNQLVNNARRSQREQATVEVDQVASTLVATTDPAASRQLRELDRALGHLSKGQRAVVLLVGLEGMSYDEAAKVLRVPIGTIRSRLGRARQALRFLMGIDEATGSVDRTVRRRPALDSGIAA